LLLGAAPALAQQDNALELWVAQYQKLLPRQVSDCDPSRDEPLAKAADAIEKWAAHLARYEGADDPAAVVARLDRLVAAKEQIDQMLLETLALRTQFVNHKHDPQLRERIRAYLRTMTGLLDLSGRLRHQFVDAINYAARTVASQDTLRERLVDLLDRRNSDVGAAVMAWALIDPPPETANRAQPARHGTKVKLLNLIAKTGEFTQVERLAQFIRDERTPPDLVVLAADTIRKIGLPQDPRPEDLAAAKTAEEAEALRPPISAAELHKLLADIPPEQLGSQLNQLREELHQWLAVRKAQGLEGDSYRLGPMEIRPGDWLLMRNPSPYNLFTDLSPGLFTHVGIVTMEQGSDGRRRMVVVDLPERGRNIPAENVETYIQETRYFMFLRHPDPGVAGKIAEVASTIIGNDSEFDLNFRTDRIVALKGKPLRGEKIKTYCAGLFVLTSQETGLPHESFFPFPDGSADGHTARNMKEMGMSIGNDFVSPTGSIFSPEMQVAGFRLPMYDPRREVEEVIFNHFAECLRTKLFVESHDTMQALRLKMAEYAKTNPALDRALRLQERVGDELDLVAAAKTQAVVETLDEIAYNNSGDLETALIALTSGPPENLAQYGYTPEQIAEFRKMRQRHADLLRRFEDENDGLTFRQLRIELVNYYSKRGKEQLTAKYFSRQPSKSAALPAPQD
jgi:hypothetical protein